jgi:thiol-disulfide isomerase/thioredoxin
MRLLWKIVTWALSLALIGVVGVAALFLLAARRVAGRMQPPRLARIDQPASDLVYTTLDGRAEHLAGSRGEVVFLNLWGTWCIQCVAEMPSVERLYQHYKGDPQVKFLIVSRLDPPARVQAYARLNHYDLPFYLMRDEDIPPSMQFNQFPSTFIYAKDGRLEAQDVAAADWSDASVVAFIDRLKAQ